MKKAKYLAIPVIVLAAIVAVLLYNKSKIEAKSKPAANDVYYVTVETTAFKQIDESIQFTGTVNANNDVNIVSETQGKVTANYTKVGDYKKAGSVLFQVDDELKKANLMAAEASYEKAKKDLERFESLYKQKSVTDAQLDQATLAYKGAEAQYIAAKRQHSDTKITTPISGVVTMRNADVGTMIQPGMVTANIVDISKLKVRLNVSEKDAFRIKAGDKVEISTEVYPEAEFEGKVDYVSDKGDDAHTYPVEVSISNNSKFPMKAGMFAKVNFTSVERKNLLAIPRESLVGSIKDAQVYVVESGAAKLKSIVTGAAFGTMVEVINGLDTGETLIVNGQNNLFDGARVQILED